MVQNNKGFGSIASKGSSESGSGNFNAYTLESEKKVIDTNNAETKEKFAKFTDDFDLQSVSSSASGFKAEDSFDYDIPAEPSNSAAFDLFNAAPAASERSSKISSSSSGRKSNGKNKSVSEKKGFSGSKAAIIAVVGVLCVAAVVGCTMFLSSRPTVPYSVDNGFAELSSGNSDKLFSYAFSEIIKEKSISVKTENNSYSFKLDDFGFDYAPDGKVEEEYIDVPLADGSGYAVQKISTINNVCFNETAIRDFIADIAAQYGTPMVRPSYTIDGDTMTVLAGTDGMSVDFDDLTAQLVKSIQNLDFSEISVGLGVLKAPEVDMEQIYKEVACDPVNASFTVTPAGEAIYVDETVGIDFDLAAATAKVKGSSQDKWDIKLKLTQPEVTVKSLKSPKCPDLISAASTKYNAGNKNRSHNLALAGEKVNGLVLQPGEIFSFNGTVGKRNAANGFKTATVYTGEGLDEDYGGGICQTSTTIYNAAIKANLEIVERKNHYYTVGYWPMAGADATVSWGSCDLKIKNNREYPVKFEVESSSGTITCRVYGISDGVTAYLENEIYAYKDYETIHKPKDSTKSNSSGSRGMSVRTYRVVMKNGNVISRNLEAKSIYKPLNAVIYDGETSSSITTTTTPTPTTTTKPKTTPTATSSTTTTTTTTAPVEEVTE